VSMDNVRVSFAGADADISADSDALILVDESDREVGHLSKALCHAGRGVLHRAFSLLIFNEAGELLLQRRAATKRLWPLHWSNSCCSHPRRNEPMESAIHRRLHEELGIRCPMRYLFKFQYQAQYGSAGAEHELCSVYVGRYGGLLKINRNEIDSWRWVEPRALEHEMSGHAACEFTPWFKLEWARISSDYPGELQALRRAGE